MATTGFKAPPQWHWPTDIPTTSIPEHDNAPDLPGAFKEEHTEVPDGNASATSEAGYTGDARAKPREEPHSSDDSTGGEHGGLECVVYVSRSSSPHLVNRRSIYQKACNPLLPSPTSLRTLRRADYFDLANAKAPPNTSMKVVCSPGATQIPIRKGISGSVQRVVSATA